MRVGTKIRFTKTLTEPANEDHPALQYAHKNQTGEITEIGGCQEGYWVKTDNWPHPFGCERKEFEVIEEQSNG